MLTYVHATIFVSSDICVVVYSAFNQNMSLVSFFSFFFPPECWCQWVVLGETIWYHSKRFNAPPVCFVTANQIERATGPDVALKHFDRHWWELLFLFYFILFCSPRFHPAGWGNQQGCVPNDVLKNYLLFSFLEWKPMTGGYKRKREQCFCFFFVVFFLIENL